MMMRSKHLLSLSAFRQTMALARAIRRGFTGGRYPPKHNNVMVFASELAALVGLNPYKPMAQVFPELLKRSYPEEFQKLRSAGGMSTEEHLKLILDQTNTTALYESSGEAAASATDLKDLHDRADQVEQAVDASVPASTDPATRKLLKQELRSRMHMDFGTAKEDVAVAELERATLVQQAEQAIKDEMQELVTAHGAAPEAAEKLKAKTVAKATEELAKVPVERSGQVEAQQLHSVVARAVEEVMMDPLETKDLQVRPGVLADVTFPSVQKRLETAAKRSNISTPKTGFKFTSRAVGRTRFTNRPIAVGGKIDAMTNDGRIVEVKNRMRKLFSSVPVYELVQVHTYMFVYKANACTVVQQLKHDTSSVRSSDIPWDSKLWDGRVVPYLQLAVDFVDLMATEPATQHLMGLGSVGPIKGEAVLTDVFEFYMSAAGCDDISSGDLSALVLRHMGDRLAQHVTEHGGYQQYP